VCCDPVSADVLPWPLNAAKGAGMGETVVLWFWAAWQHFIMIHQVLFKQKLCTATTSALLSLNNARIDFLLLFMLSTLKT